MGRRKIDLNYFIDQKFGYGHKIYIKSHKLKGEKSFDNQKSGFHNKKNLNNKSRSSSFTFTFFCFMANTELYTMRTLTQNPILGAFYDLNDAYILQIKNLEKWCLKIVDH
ncbi:hypothetical protein BpHYR1_006773 [Brachionus plicatilis]|uniref:Uncharacterized protein n=1 Tax=Brachionus plicatilis TaxID=10195 RepID=A0A3M7SYG7_BRAPC|nr:hypothetical protein BpHYR1_006773 [Brachionus plicatilis]